MDTTPELIVSVEPRGYNIVRIETNRGTSYEADLSLFNKVYCYPSKDEWSNVIVDSYGIDLVWHGKAYDHP